MALIASSTCGIGGWRRLGEPSTRGRHEPKPMERLKAEAQDGHSNTRRKTV